MRLLLCGVQTETVSFNPEKVKLEDFQCFSGEELISRYQGSNTELAGFIDTASRYGCEILPAFFAVAAPGGPVEEVAFLKLKEKILEGIRGFPKPDGILCVMHGAMVAEQTFDASGVILEAIREIVGDGTPIVTTLDFHANVTHRFVTNSDGVVGYHTFPHIDMYETGKRGTELLLSIIQGEINPRLAFVKLPLLLPPENARTTDGPMSHVIARIEQWETKEKGCVTVSVFQVQPWLDIPDVGSSVVAITDGDEEKAKVIARDIAELLWSLRKEFKVNLWPPEMALQRIRGSKGHPFILVDSADAVSSGAPGDNTTLLRALITHEQGLGGLALIPIVDREAVQVAAQHELGDKIRLCVGGKLTPWSGLPVEITGRLLKKSEGTFRISRGVEKGMVFDRGLTVVLGIGNVRLVISERKASTWSLDFYESLGLSPRDAKIVVVKSPNGFRTEYEPIASECLLIDTGGICNPNLEALPWRRIRRPIYPLDKFDRLALYELTPSQKHPRIQDQD